jgi:hypothetical protein
MASSDSLEASPVQLNSPKDWDKWITVVRIYAENEDIWQYLNPDPTYDADDPTKVIPNEKLVKPARPTFADVKQGAQRINDLNDAETRQYQALQSDYRDDRKEYEAKHKSIKELEKYVVRNIGNYLETIEKVKGLEAQLKALKERVAPSDFARENEILDRYETVRKSAKSSKIEDWVAKWQKVLAEAKALNLPDVQGIRPTRHFLQAVQSIDSAFSNYWMNQIEAKAIDGKKDWEKDIPDGIKISNIFEKQYRALKSSHNKHGGAFPATFQGEEPPQPQGQQSQGQQPQGQGKGRKPVCLCGKNHYYGKCFYLNAAVRPDGWKPDQEIQNKIDQAIKEKPSLKDAISRSIKFITEKLGKSSKKEEKEGSTSSTPPAAAFAGFSQTLQPPQGNSIQTSLAPACFHTGKLYPLHNSFILDSGSDWHICNSIDRFIKGTYKPLNFSQSMWAGDGDATIEGYGEVIIRIQTPSGTGVFRLLNVAYVPTFHVNVISVRRLAAKQLSPDFIQKIITFNGKELFSFQDIHNQFVVEYNPIKEGAAFPVNSRLPRTPLEGTAMLWHKRLGHLGAEALEKLVENTTGAKITGPLKIDCADCSGANGIRVISRRRGSRRSPRPFWRIYFDIFSLEVAYNGMRKALVICDEYTGMYFVYALPNQQFETIFKAIDEFETWVYRQFDLRICIVHRDGDRALQTDWKKWIRNNGMEDEISAPYTQAQNAPAERSGGVIAPKARSMRLSANLLPYLGIDNTGLGK